MEKIILVLILLVLPFQALAQQPLPIIDMHLHAYPADANGPPPIGLCLPLLRYLPPLDLSRDDPMSLATDPPCPNPVWSPMTDEEVMQGTIEVLERRNIIGVLSGTPERLATWTAAAPGRFLPSLQLNVARDWAATPEVVRRLVDAGSVVVLGEVSNQYAGIAPNDDRMEPYWALAEELDIPVAYHMGEGPPWAALLYPTYRVRLTSPYLLEEVLSRHPRLRLSVMHYASPLVDEMIAMLGAYPQIYVDLGGIQWFYPREYFYAQLGQLIDAGFGKRVMFGSDQMTWPGVIEPAIAIIEEAPFLSAEQKRDILYNNAARFLRLSEEEIARHHGKSPAATSGGPDDSAPHPRPVVVAAQEGYATVSANGVQALFKIGSVSNGAVQTTVGSFVFPPGHETVTHLHEVDEETIYVTEGELTVTLGNEVFTAGPGALVFAPPGTWMSLANRTDREASGLALISRGEAEECFRVLFSAESDQAALEEALALCRLRFPDEEEHAH